MSERETMFHPTWLAAGRLISQAALGGAAGEQLQWLVAAALVWREADCELGVTTAAAEAAIQGPRRRFDDAKRAQEAAGCSEQAAREELFAYARALHVETEEKT